MDNLLLRATAIKNSLVPRLEALIQHCIHYIHKVYGIEVFQDSSISKHPNFRSKRKNYFDLHITQAVVGVSGQRSYKWNGFNNVRGDKVKILPFRFGFVATRVGVRLMLQHGMFDNINNNSLKKISNFHIKNHQKIAILFSLSETRLYDFKNTSALATLEEKFLHLDHKNITKMNFFGHNYSYPIQRNDIKRLVTSFIIMYPIYDSYIQMAKGEKIRFGQLFNKLRKWLDSGQGVFVSITNSHQGNQLRQTQVNEKAQQYIKIIPSIRWQVFQRDSWKCVSCGRTAHDGVILHIDHIIPRSLGGLDIMENYQTLCHVCSIGKSNKDSTDLRQYTQ